MTIKYGINRVMIALAVLLAFGALKLMSSVPLISILLVMVGVILLARSGGLEFDTTERRYREFTSFFGYKRGEWKPMDQWVAICVLSPRTVATTEDRIGRQTNYARVKHEVMLVNETHRRKLLLDQFRHLPDAQMLADQVKQKLNLPVVPYNPKVSEKTRQRRRR